MKTHVTVIPSDGIISVDGEVLFLDGIKSETFHALQWHDGAGHVEPGNGLPNEELSTDDYAGRVAPFVALWEEEKARLEEEANRPPTDEELAAQAVAEARVQSRSILMARMQTDMVQTAPSPPPSSPPSPKPDCSRTGPPARPTPRATAWPTRASSMR